MATALLVLDVQRNMLLPPDPVPDAVAVSAAIEEILDRARSAGATVIHIRNNGPTGYPDEPGTPGWELIHEVRDGEHLVDKFQSDAFAGTNLAVLVPSDAEIVVVGMQSDYCIRATTLTALERGHSVTLVRGAHATYDDDEPASAISKHIEEQLAAAGATVAERPTVTFSATR